MKILVILETMQVIYAISTVSVVIQFISQILSYEHFAYVTSKLPTYMLLRSKISCDNSYKFKPIAHLLILKTEFDRANVSMVTEVVANRDLLFNYPSLITRKATI